jgi:hypothetical protein
MPVINSCYRLHLRSFALKCLWLAALGFWNSSIQAQEADTARTEEIPKFRVGLEAGALFSTLTGSGVVALQLPGVTAGLFFEKPINARWEAAGGIGFSMRGFARNPDPENGDFEQLTARFNYLELRLGARYKLLNNRKLALEAFLMPAVLLGQSVRDAFGDVGNVQQGEPFDLGLSFGVSYAVNPKWVFTARFRHSVLPVLKNVDGNTQFNPVFGQVNLGQFHASLMAGVRYSFFIAP